MERCASGPCLTRGSASGEPARPLVTSTGETGAVVTPPGLPPAPPGPLTGAAVWSSDVVDAHAAISAAAAIAVNREVSFARIASPLAWRLVSFDERPPGRLAHVAAGRCRQPLLEAPVGRDRGKH